MRVWKARTLQGGCAVEAVKVEGLKGSGKLRRPSTVGLTLSSRSIESFSQLVTGKAYELGPLLAVTPSSADSIQAEGEGKLFSGRFHARL